jgi:hypothetical protein
MQCTSVPWLNRCGQRRDDGHDRQRTHQIDFGGYPGSGYPLDRRSWSFIRVRFFHTEAKKPELELLPPFGRETALRGRPLTKTEEDETIIINRSGRSTYPEQKSVLTSGATPHIVPPNGDSHRLKDRFEGGPYGRLHTP